MAARRLQLTRTLGPLVVAWIERELVHGPGDVQGQPIELDDEFVWFIFRAYEIDAAGRRVIWRAVFSRLKGRAKSEFGAMIACAEALGPVRFRGWDHDGRPLGGPITAPFIPCFATEEDQAGDGYAAIYFMLKHGAISRTPGLDVGLTRTYLPDGGKITVETSKAASKDGGKETFAWWDETHLYVGDPLIRLHATVRRNLTKRKIAEPWGLETTTMYAPGENSVAEGSHAYYKKITNGKIHDSGFLFDHREGPADFDYESDEQLRAAIIEAAGEAAGWLDVDRMVAEARDEMTNKSDVIRYFVNRPAKREEAVFIKADTWTGLTKIGRIERDATVCLGGDGSRTFDTTVIAWAAPLDAGRVRVGARVFSVRESAPHHVLHPGGSIDFEDVEAFILDRFDYFTVTEAAYDPRYLERSADILLARLPSAALVPVEPTSKHMREALQTFERLCLEGKLEHDGDPVIAAHLANCAVERGESADEIRRVRKIEKRKPIDAVPAMALAVWRAAQAPLESEPLVRWA